MKVFVDKEKCIGCGLCADICPSVFIMNDDGLAEVIKQPNEEDEACTNEAIESCPVEAIEEIEE